MRSSREKKIASEQSIHNTAVLFNSSPVGLSSWFTGQDLEWIGTSVITGYHPHYESFTFAHLNGSNQVAYLVTSQHGQTMKLEESLDDIGLCIQLIEPFCDVAESDTFDMTAIIRMKALVYYFTKDWGVLEELNVYDRFWTDLNDAIRAHHKAHERTPTTKRSQWAWIRSYQPRGYCILSARIFLDRLPDDQRSALIEAAPQATEPPSASTLGSSPISAVATSNKRPYGCINEAEETSTKRTQTSFTQTLPENGPIDHLEIMRSYAEEILAECDHVSRERVAYKTQLEANNNIILELEDIVRSHCTSSAAAQASLEEANQKHAAEIDSYAKKIKMFQVDTKALNGRVNELLAANEHMRQERDQMEKDHEEILQEETARANKAARAKLYEQLGKDMLLVAEEEARGLERE